MRGQINPGKFLNQVRPKMRSQIDSEIKQLISQSRNDILALLRTMVECNSFSHNKAGNDRMQEIVQEQMPEGYSLKVHKNENLGDNYVYAYSGKATQPVVLHGHVDTLCPEDPEFCTIYERENKLYGPGVNDMKGGLCVLIWSLKILKELDLFPEMSFMCIFNTDEELGSSVSKDLFRYLNRENAKCGLKFECGELENTVVTTRKGISRYRLDIAGRDAHFGNLKERKVSAIDELGHQIRFIEDLNKNPDIAANVGKVSGGLAANKVAESASMEFEVRCWEPETLQTTIEHIEKSLKSPNVAGCTMNLTRLSYRPPWKPDPASRKLFKLIRETAEDMGQRIVEEKRGGMSDSNWVASSGTPALDGLGPLGQGDFTRNEFIITQSLFDRIELVTRLLVKLGNTELS